VTFDGATYDPALDRDRLTKQLGRVYEALSDGEWWTLYELAAFSDGSEAAISARIRDLRKPRHGGYTIHRRRHGLHVGLWEYRMEPRSDGDWIAARDAAIAARAEQERKADRDKPPELF
jgi:hypothetical protein